MMVAHDPWHEVAQQAQAQWEAFLADPSAEEPVHQARVKLRQLRSMLAAVKKAVAPEAYAFWQQAWRDMSRLLGGLRQCDVLDEGSRLLEEQRGPLADDGGPDLPWRRLRRQETAPVRAAALALPCGPLWQRFDAWLVCYRQGVSRAKERRAAQRRLDRWVEQLAALSRQDRAYQNIPLAHERRILGKKLRYALAAFFPEAPPELGLALKRWQACLGVLHDSLLHCELARRWADERQLSAEQTGLLLGWEAGRAAFARKQAPKLEGEVIRLYRQWRQ